ncbi:hypothetical protein G9A89_008395 [Geosiphon pyriformis]|nr:hypothetical protein G9A89_008395 [Geosiphon pyriformis]
MNTSSKSLVAIFKALLLLGSYKKPMPMVNKKLLDGHQQILEKITPLSLPDNPTMDMAIELAQKIENNQRMYLGSTLLVFAPAPIMAPALQMAAISFAV